MTERLYNATLFALYQVTITVGIIAMPLALAANRAGISLPIHRLIEPVGQAYENAQMD